MGNLFGTDGIRGIAGEELTSRTAFALGNALSRLKAAKNAKQTHCLIRATITVMSSLGFSS